MGIDPRCFDGFPLGPDDYGKLVDYSTRIESGRGVLMLVWLGIEICANVVRVADGELIVVCPAIGDTIALV